MGRGVTGVRRTAQKAMWLERAFEAKIGGDEVGGLGAGLEQTGRVGPGKELGVVPSVMGNQWREPSLNGSPRAWVLLGVLGRARHPLWSCLPTASRRTGQADV